MSRSQASTGDRHTIEDEGMCVDAIIRNNSKKAQEEEADQMINKQWPRPLTRENLYLISSAHVKVKCVARSRWCVEGTKTKEFSRGETARGLN